MIWCWLVDNKDVLQALGPFAIALTAFVVGAITILMNRHFNKVSSEIAKAAELTDRNRLKFQLFDKRYEVYRAAYEYILAIQRPPFDEDRFRQHDGTIVQVKREAQFLFPDEKIANALQDIRKPVYELHGLILERDTLKQALHGPDQGRVRQLLAENWEKQKAANKDLDAELATLTILFMPHLRVDQIS